MSTAPTDVVNAVPDRIVGAVTGALECHAVFLGDQLGWYDAIAELGSVTPCELAERTATDARYAQEWLEHQAVTGNVTVADASAPPKLRRYAFAPGAEEALTDRDSLAYVRPLAVLAAGAGRRLDDLVAAYRAGTGVSWAEHGDDARRSQAAANRPMFLRRLGPEFLASIPDVDIALLAGGRVADIGCGFGWSSIGVALAYPEALVDGFDLDEPSIEAARANARAHGVSGRVAFRAVDATTLRTEELPSYDVVLALECVHDLADPVAVLAGMRRMAGDDGVVIVMDEAVGHEFTGAPDAVEQFMYGFSLVCCLPDGRSHAPSAATGTVMRPATLARYATAAGFRAVTELPIDAALFRFYRLEQ